MKVFIIGNGVSMDVANTPRDLIKAILDLYVKNQNRNYVRDAHFPRFKSFLKELSKGYKYNFKSLKAHKARILGNIFSRRWVLEDIEFLLTIIDLNLNNPHKVRFPGSVTPYDAVSVRHFKKNDLEEFRRIIETYLVLLLSPSNISTPNRSLTNFCNRLVSDGDMIITFNYDLLIERELWRLKKWTPIDGYQIGSINTADPRLTMVCQEIGSKGISRSNVILFKLHGSLNWDKYPNGRLEIRLTDSETGMCYFDNITATGPNIGQAYQGKADLIGMPPSFIKVFPRAEFYELWDKALNEIGKAREVYIIGYKLPEADVMAHLLIGKIGKRCPVYSIKPSAEELKIRILQNCGLQNVTALNYKFSDWVSAGFPKT